jgi:hypothetical protein
MVATGGHQLQIVLEREQLTADLALVFGCRELFARLV